MAVLEQQQQQQQQQSEEYARNLTAEMSLSSSSSTSSSHIIPLGPTSEDQPRPPLNINVTPPPPPIPPPPSMHGHNSWLDPSAPHDLSTYDSTPLCAGCRLRIVDKYYLQAVGRRWHTQCLRCAECGGELDGQGSCFERNGFIFCKEDYAKIHSAAASSGCSPPRSCSRCHMPIATADLVMKARECLFHVECFRCLSCDVPLRKGDLFGMFGEQVYCRAHFELQQQQALSIPAADAPVANEDDQQQQPQTPPGLAVQPPPPPPPPAGFFPPNGSPFSTPPGFALPQEGWFPGAGGPGEFHSGPEGDFAFENNNEPLSKKRRGRKKRKVEAFAPMNGFMEGAFPPGSMDGSAQAKTKRARTSFKHHQLRIMKAHFQINQNPDSRELKMLSQKTGLDKKVLQVWFQNARAKWRRVNAQSGSGGSGSSNTQQQQQQQQHDQQHEQQQHSMLSGPPPPAQMGMMPMGLPDDLGDSDSMTN